jgi:hypothetical protein
MHVWWVQERVCLVGPNWLLHSHAGGQLLDAQEGLREESTNVFCAVMCCSSECRTCCEAQLMSIDVLKMEDAC